MNSRDDLNNDRNGGIKFYHGSWKEAVGKAKNENKVIFLEIYASWCGPCKKLKTNTFSNNRVGNYFNARFINVSLDGENGEGEMLANQFGLSGYPALYFIDTEGKIIAQSEGYMNVDELLDFARTGLK